MAIPKDIKKSKFVEVLSAEQNDRFDFTRGAQNLAINFTNLAASLGVSGTLASLGEITAIPVLKQIAGINYIRSILAGSGIAVDVSAQDGIEISHNFTVDGGGVAVMINEGSSSPVFRSFVGGTGINVSGSGNTIQIATSGVAVSTKTVIVYSIDDFPVPVAGVITLLDDTEYQLQNDISTANRFIFGDGTVLSGSDGALITLEYTGTGAMLTAADKDIKITDLILTCSSGTLFNVTSSTGLHIFRHYNGSVNCQDVGLLDNLFICYFFNLIFNISGDGFTFTNNTTVFLMDTISINIPSGTGNGFTLGTATFSSFTLDKVLFNISTSGYEISGLAGSGNINAGGLGVINNTKSFGTSTFSDNISPYDDRWEAQLNSNIINSFDLMLATHGGATIVIATAATPVIVGATWTTEDAHRFTGTAGGRWTYVGKGTHVSVTASISADIATATDNVSFFLYLNGGQIANSQVTRSFSAGSIGNVVMIWDVELATNDYLELWVQNDDTNVNVNIDTIKMRIRS